MAARKKASRKKAARKKASRSRAGARKSGLGGFGSAWSRVELPPTLRDYAGQVRRRLDGLERQVTRTQIDVRRRAARLLREASHQLGRLEAEGEAGWRRLTAPYRRQLVDLLRRLEKALNPPQRRGASGARKATRRVSKAMRDTASAIE